MMRQPWFVIVLALLLYTPLFLLNTIGPLDFWSWMAATVGVLLVTIAALDRQWPRWCLGNIRSRFFVMGGLGIASAVVLYFIFFAGDYFSRLLLPFASNNIQNVYALKSGTSELRIGLLIALLIGPGEELIWRAYIQEKLSKQMSTVKAALLATFFYTVIHLGSGNMMLVLAALVCGLFWGALYMRLRSVWLNVASHIVWDLAVFMFFPF